MSSANSAKVYTYDGRSQTLKAWSGELGIKLVTLYQRLRKGWPVSMVLGQPADSSKAGRRHLYTYNGVTASASEWAKRTGIPEDTLHYRLTHRKMWTVEKALTTPYSPNTGVHPTSLTLNGRTMSVVEWAKELGIREGTLRMRIYRGHDVEDVLDPEVDSTQIRKPLNVTFNGETHNLREWSEITGISVQTLSLRMHKGWKLEDVFLKKVAKVEARKFKCDGSERTLSEWAKVTGTPESVIRGRLNSGWPLKDALFSPQQPRGRVAMLKTLDGKRKTIAEWAEEHDVPASVVRGRIARGWPLKRALETPKGQRGRRCR